MDFKIQNTKVDNISESILDSALPFKLEPWTEEEYNELVFKIEESLKNKENIDDEWIISRLKVSNNLAGSESGSGHDCFLKGITVRCLVTYPMYWSMQWQRYHFHNIVSSMSKMHCLSKMKVSNFFNSNLDTDVVDVGKLQQKIDRYNIMQPGEEKEKEFVSIVSTLPCGFMAQMSIVTNYLQLKSVYKQRRSHKLPEWKYFCNWTEDLPNSYLITNSK